MVWGPPERLPDEALEVRPIIWRWVPRSGGLDVELRAHSGLLRPAMSRAFAPGDA